MVNSEELIGTAQYLTPKRCRRSRCAYKDTQICVCVCMCLSLRNYWRITFTYLTGQFSINILCI